MSTTLPFDYDIFKVEIPEYANPLVYPESTIEVYWDLATTYVSDNTQCNVLTEKAQRFALNLMTAHLIYLNGIAASGGIPGVMQSSTIRNVNVDLTPPPVKNQWGWWLQQTPYGQRLNSLLLGNSSGGYYIGGSPVRSSFRGTYYSSNCC